MRREGIGTALESRPGIYRIYNLVTKKSYIGSTVNVYRRYYRHMQVLKQKLKENIRMYEDCEKYGVGSFIIGVIEYCDKEDLLEKEQAYYEKWMPEYNVWKNVYNATGREYTEEQLKFFRSYNHGPKNIPQFRKILKEAWKKRRASPNYQEGIDKMAAAKRGHKHSEETKKLISLKGKGKRKPIGFSEKVRQARLRDSEELKKYRGLKIKEAKSNKWQT